LGSFSIFVTLSCQPGEEKTPKFFLLFHSLHTSDPGGGSLAMECVMKQNARMGISWSNYWSYKFPPLDGEFFCGVIKDAGGYQGIKSSVGE